LDFLCLFQRAHPAMLASPPACRKPEMKRFRRS
jgi:hypothetical protein